MCAGYCNTTEDNNTYVGHNAGYQNLTGSCNTAIGFAAGKCLNASYNTFLGANAGGGGCSCATGASNTFIGAFAGRCITWDQPCCHWSFGDIVILLVVLVSLLVMKLEKM